MQTNFDMSLRAVLQHEGGYVNNPKDPGGPTNKGITIATARLYISPSFSIAQLRSLTIDQAGIVYRKQYADKVAFDALPSGLDYCSFDYGVNSGPGRPQNVLRALVGVKGKGPVTAEVIALIAKRSSVDLINAMCDERLRFLKALKTWATFGKGWERRVREVRAMALRMAAAKAGVATAPAQPPKVVVPPPTEPAQGKAVPSTGTEAAAPIVGTVAGSAAVATAAQATFHFPMWGIVVLAVAVIVIGAVVAGIVISRKEEAADTPAPGTVPVPSNRMKEDAN